MAERTFGWIQDSGSSRALKAMLLALVPGSSYQSYLLDHKIPAYIPERYGRYEISRLIEERTEEFPYELLKGRGFSCQLTAEENEKMFGYSALEAKELTGKGGRGNAACSGLVQIALEGQKKLPDGGKRPYQADWQAECFLRWGISIGLLDYHAQTDSCSLSELGKRYAAAAVGSAEEKEILGEAYLSYPPAVRVLSLLDMQGHLTKYEIGRQLGFIGEAGFTSISQNMFVSSYCMETDKQEKQKLRANAEGSSDKYARMIASWLCDIGWAVQDGKEVEESYASMVFRMKIGQAYRITYQGRKNLKRATGSSSSKRLPKRVFWDMLATRGTDKEYKRNKRAVLLLALKRERTLEQLRQELEKHGMTESTESILDDIKSFQNIGLSVTEKGAQYKLAEEIIGLELPKRYEHASKSELSVRKDEIRDRLKHLDHKYLLLMDLSWDKDTNREFEIETMDLLTNELGYHGEHLGGASKPDGLFYLDKQGVIVDTKAYSRGYSLPVSQADEMIRYIEENKARGEINSNHWWEKFGTQTEKFYYLFVSSCFISGYRDRLKYISMRTGVCGGAVSAENLLLLAERLKSGEMKKAEIFDCFKNDEIMVQETEV